MQLSKQEFDLLRSLYKTGIIEIVKKIVNEQVNMLRAARVRKENNEETLWNLAETIGGEKQLYNLIDYIHDLCNQDTKG